MFGKNVIEEARKKSIELLKELSTDKGFIASALDKDNYKRVWSRDGIIISLASLAVGDKDLLKTYFNTISTLKRHQDKTGRIPSNVSLEEDHVSYGTTVGRIDATLWYVIGVCKYILKVDTKTKEEFKESLEKAIFYLECLELNGRGLIYVPAGGDWADEYINEGYILFDQVLYAIALKIYSEVYNNRGAKEKYKQIIEVIDINYFPDIKDLENEHVYNKNVFKKACEKYQPPLPIASFNPFDVNHVHDLFALALLMNLDIKSNVEKEKIEKYIFQKHQKDFPIIPAFDPIINEQHPKWKSLTHNFLFDFKNKPYEYQNGGMWPIAHGFYLASKDTVSKKEIQDFAEILERDNYVFPEFYNGLTFKQGGTERLGWSAAGYLLAYSKLKTNNKPFKL